MKVFDVLQITIDDSWGLYKPLKTEFNSFFLERNYETKVMNFGRKLDKNEVSA